MIQPIYYGPCSQCSDNVQCSHCGGTRMQEISTINTEFSEQKKDIMVLLSIGLWFFVSVAAILFVAWIMS